MLKKKAIIESFNTFLLELTPNLITIAIFGTYIYTGHNIDAKSAFTLVSTLMALQMPIKQTPAAISAILDAKVALDRICKFLVAEELQADYIKKNESLSSGETAIQVKNGNFYWLTEEEKTLKKKKEEEEKQKNAGSGGKPEGKKEKEKKKKKKEKSQNTESESIKTEEKTENSPTLEGEEGEKKLEKPVLKDINLEIKKGSFVAVLGE